MMQTCSVCKGHFKMGGRHVTKCLYREMFSHIDRLSELTFVFFQISLHLKGQRGI